MESNTANYAAISSIEELRRQKDRLRRKMEMQEDLLLMNTGRVKNTFQVVSSVGSLFLGVSRYPAILSLAYAAFKFYKKHRKP